MVTEIISVGAFGKAVLTGKRQEGTAWDDENILDMVWVATAKVYTQVNVHHLRFVFYCMYLRS